MGIHKLSRYLGQEQITATLPDGSLVQDYEHIDTTATNDERATAKVTRLPPGMRFTDVARRQLGSPRLWYQIAKYNPDTFYPLDAQDGQILNVPPRTDASRGVP